jgi:hypothetical protein
MWPSTWLRGKRPKKEYARPRAVIGRSCTNISRWLPVGKTCLSLTSRAVSSIATETPFTSRARPYSGALDEEERPVTRIIVSADMRGSDEQRILLDEEVRPEHMSDEHSASQLLERLGWAVTDAERAPALAAH